MENLLRPSQKDGSPKVRPFRGSMVILRKAGIQGPSVWHRALQDVQRLPCDISVDSDDRLP